MTNYTPLIIELLFLMCMFAIVSMSLNLTIGYSGLFNLGQVGFFALGALGSTIATVYWGFGFFVGVSLGILISICVALLIGIPSLKLKGDYFAIATLGFGEIVRVLLKAYEPFALAVDGVPKMAFGRLGFLALGGYEIQDIEVFGGMTLPYEVQELWITFLLALGCAFMVQRLVKSPYGRVLKAVKEDEIAASAIGKDVRSYKLQSFLIGAAMASLAGSLFVHHVTVFAPVNFTIQLTILFLVMVILGGMGSNIGAIIGAVVIAIIYYLPNLLDFPDYVDAGATNLMIFSILIIVVVLFRPKGIMGRREFDLRRLLLRLRIMREKKDVKKGHWSKEDRTEEEEGPEVTKRSDEEEE